MKLITRDTDYAIRALCYIAKHKEEIISAKELVAKLKIPKSFLRKILQILNKEKILKSYKGKNGGFKLAVLANRIFLLNLMRIFQGTFKLNEHIFKNKICPNIKRCKFKKKLDEIEKYMITKLKCITLSSLI